MDRIVAEKIVKLRKPFACFGCGRELLPGALMKKQVGIFEGRFQRTGWCEVCQEYLKQHTGYTDEHIYFGELRCEDPEGWEKVRADVEGEIKK